MYATSIAVSTSLVLLTTAARRGMSNFVTVVARPTLMSWIQIPDIWHNVLPSSLGPTHIDFNRLCKMRQLLSVSQVICTVIVLVSHKYMTDIS